MLSDNLVTVMPLFFTHPARKNAPRAHWDAHFKSHQIQRYTQPPSETKMLMDSRFCRKKLVDANDDASVCKTTSHLFTHLLINS